MSLRITETPNPLTVSLDAHSASADQLAGAVRTLRSADAQVLGGYMHYPACVDHDQLERLSLLSYYMRACCCDPAAPGLVIFSGCGTSGRIGYALATKLNRYARAAGYSEGDVFGYLMAGGPDAIISPRENVEDSAKAGIEDLVRLVQLHKPSQVLLVGITCGLSATYVGSYLYAIRTLNDSKVSGAEAGALAGLGCYFASALFGFNPVSLLKKTAVAGWDTTMKDIAAAMDAATAELIAGSAAPSDARSSASTLAPEQVLLNPVVGPEAVTGSTRMKGGTATKLLLEAAAMLALRPATEVATGGAALAWLRGFVQRQCMAMDAAYSDVGGLARVSWAAGQALRAGARVLYVAQGTAGLLGVVDSSECPPTYGAAAKDVWCCWVDPGVTSAGGMAAPDLLAPSCELIGSGKGREQAGGDSGTSATGAAAGAGAGPASRRWWSIVEPEAVLREDLPAMGPEDVVIDVNLVAGEHVGCVTSEDVRLPSAAQAVVDAAVARGCQRCTIDVVCGGVGVSTVASASGASPAGTGSPQDRTRVVLRVDADEEDIALYTFSKRKEISSAGAAAEGAVSEGSSPARSPGAPARLPTCGEDLATKLALNCVSTLAHVVKGCVFGNRMINLSVTNMKLFGRAADLAASLAGCSIELATRCLVRAIHGIDEEEEEEGGSEDVYASAESAHGSAGGAGSGVRSLALQAALALPVAEHVSAAAKKYLVVPTATLLAAAEARGRRITIKEAQDNLAAAASLREAVSSVASTGGS